MSAVTVLDSVPLATRVEIARAAGSPLVFSGATLEELHQLLVDAREVERAFAERSVAVADARASIEREARLNRRWLIATCVVAVAALAARSGGLLS